MESTDRLERLFIAGRYRDLLEALQQLDVLTLNNNQFVYLIAALSFNGRRAEAQTLFNKRQAQLALSSLVSCRFFLGIAFCRAGEFAKAREFLGANSRVAASKRNEEMSFYIFQGLGFYRYICADFNRARAAAEKSLGAATFSGFAYGKALASDLYGHSLIQLGRIQAGLLHLEQALLLANELGNGGLKDAVTISKLVYRAQFGLAPECAVSELQTALETLDPQNSHSNCGLLLELANQLMLRGKLNDAARALEKASTIIYQSQHGRFQQLLSLRWAEVSYRSGQSAAALHTIRQLRIQLHPKYDRLVYIKTLGLELKLLKSLDMAPSPELVSLLQQLSGKSRNSIAQQILTRGQKLLSSSSEDKIAVLIERLKSEGNEALSQILDAGFLGLLPEHLGLKPSEKYLIFGLTGRDALVFDRGEIHHTGPISKQLFDILITLQRGEISKAELIQRVWGYEYHPLRHDQLVYQAILKLRKLLGPAGNWLESTDQGYRLLREVNFISIQGQPTRKDSAPNAAETVKKESFDGFASPLVLNHRQQQILNLLKKSRAIGVAECLEKFEVSDMTLRRDFTELIKLGLVARFGKARATRYELTKEN